MPTYQMIFKNKMLCFLSEKHWVSSTIFTTIAEVQCNKGRTRNRSIWVEGEMTVSTYFLFCSHGKYILKYYHFWATTEGSLKAALRHFTIASGKQNNRAQSHAPFPAQPYPSYRVPYRVGWDLCWDCFTV